VGEIGAHLVRKWHVAYVRVNQERRVTTHLDHRGIEQYLPCYNSTRQRKDRRVTLSVPLFPGYIFVRVAAPERMSVLTVPNIISLVGNKSGPAEIPDGHIEQLQNGITECSVHPHAYLQTGTQVLILRGPMAGFKGILIRHRNNARVVVNIDTIARAFSVEIDINDVEVLTAGGIAKAC